MMICHCNFSVVLHCTVLYFITWYCNILQDDVVQFSTSHIITFRHRAIYTTNDWVGSVRFNSVIFNVAQAPLQGPLKVSTEMSDQNIRT